MLRVAIIGCGQIADVHINEIRVGRKAEVVAVCDRHSLIAEQLAARFSVPSHFDDLDEMLDRSRPDVVHITTPPGSHLSIALRALEAGCHVYVEKPVTPTAPDTETLIREAVKASKKLTVGYSYFFEDPAIALRKLLASGALGEIVHVESVYGYNMKGPFGTAIMKSPSHWVHALPGKLIQNNLNHALCKVSEFLADDSPTIEALAFGRGEKTSFGDVRDELCEELRVMLKSGGRTANIVFTSAASPTPHFARYSGTKGSALADFRARTLVREPNVTLPTVLGLLPLSFRAGFGNLAGAAKNLRSFARAEFSYMQGMRRLVDAFYHSVLNDGPPPIPYELILRDALWMDRIFEAVSEKGGAGR